MNSICSSTACWVILALVFAGIVGQAWFVWRAHRSAEQRGSDARRQARKDQASLVEQEFDNMTKGKK